MIALHDIRKVYFIGIGGIGMSALARYFRFHGREVSGYDKTETPLTKQLVQEGIAVHYKDDVALAPVDVQLVVYTPAIPRNHSELSFYREKGYPLMKRSEVLGLITGGAFNICVAGTHGKTTISTMIAHVLRDSGYGCNAFLGGIAVNYNSNFWSNERNVCVVEADEYDRSFLQLHPDIAAISAMDADHLDIYGTEEAMQNAFVEFSNRLKSGGLLITKAGIARSNDMRAENRLTYSLESAGADVHAYNIRMMQGSYLFDVAGPGWKMENVELNMGGLHNVENAVVAITIAHYLDISAEKTKAALAGFRGVKRRFEYIIRDPKGDRVYVDDYAHHPEELRALIAGARGLFGGMKCTVIFQPHLFTRTRDLADGFAASLDLADEVFLLPIYPAREQPIAGVSSELILDKMKIKSKRIIDKQELIAWVAANRTNIQLLITAGAGDIDTIIQPIKEALT